MNTRMITAAFLAAFLGSLGLASLPVKAQVGPNKPPKSSFSNRKAATAKSGAPTRRQATQEELVEAVLGDSMNQLWDQSDEHYHEGEFNHCIGLNRILVQGDPHNMEAFATASWLLWSGGQNKEAETLLTEGIAANPNNFYMYDEMGLYWLLERKDAKSAIPYYEKAVKFDCPFLTWNSLANCYEKTDQWEKAVAAWEKATLYPKDAIALVRLKRARARLSSMKNGQ